MGQIDRSRSRSNVISLGDTKMKLVKRLLLSSFVGLASISAAAEDDVEIKTDWSVVIKRSATGQYESDELGAGLVTAALLGKGEDFAWQISPDVKKTLNALELSHQEYAAERLNKKLAADQRVKGAMKSLVEATKKDELCFWNPPAGSLKLVYKVSYALDDLGANVKQLHKGFAIVRSAGGNRALIDGGESAEIEYKRTMSFLIYDGGTYGVDALLSVRTWDRVQCYRDMCFAPVDDLPEKIKNTVDDQINPTSAPQLRWCLSGGFSRKKLKAEATQDVFLPKKVRLEVWDAGRKMLIWNSEARPSKTSSRSNAN